jgi:hypothetical protein
VSTAVLEITIPDTVEELLTLIDGGFFLTVRARDRDFGEVSSHTRDLGRTPKPGETDTLVFSLPITVRATVTCYTLDTPLAAVYLDSAGSAPQAFEPQDTINLTLTIQWVT